MGRSGCGITGAYGPEERFTTIAKLISGMAFKRTVSFNRSVRIEGSNKESLSSDGGALIGRELLDATHLGERLAEELTDYRDKRRCTHSLAKLLVQWLILLVQGWGHQRDSQDMRHDPTVRVTTSLKRSAAAYTAEHGVASQPTLSRLLGMLSLQCNLAAVGRMVTKLGLEHLLVRNGGRRHHTLVIDVDGMPIDTHGRQQGSAYNGHYRRTIYQALIAVCGETGDILGGMLRPGNRHIVRGCHDFILKIARRARKHVADRVIVRLDAGFNDGKLCTKLERADIGYVMRLKKNNVLRNLAAPYVKAGWCLTYQYFELAYQAQSWHCERRVVLVIPPHTSTLYPECYFLITNLSLADYPSAQLSRCYRKRGKAEKHLGELKAACPLALSSSPRRRAQAGGGADIAVPAAEEGDVSARNAALFLLNLLAYGLLHVARSTLHVPQRPYMSLTTFRKKYLKVGVRLVRHARYLTFLVADCAARRWARYWERFDEMQWVIIPKRC